MATFEELGLGAEVMAAVNQMGYTEATPVQEQAIPLVLAGHDVIAAAQTGTGKTAAFTLPVLDKLGHYERGHGPKCLIVTPTRELAQQIDSVARTVGKKTGHYILTVVGGVSYNPQINGLRRGVDVLVATPGRLLDLYDRGALQLDDIEVLVLDEADRMLDMGFWPDVKQIIEAIPRERQTLLFSATIDDSVMKTIGAEVHDPQFVEIAHKGTAAETVEQFVIPVAQIQKNDLLEHLLDEKGSERVIIFTRTKARAEVLAERLNREGFSAEAIHGDRSQGQRSRALKMFREGRVDILVATDVLARGIDVSGVDHVINYDVPMDPEDYIHRIGRTGRAGDEGYAITFVTNDEMYDLFDIEYLMQRAVPEMEVEGFEFDDRRPELDPERDATQRPRRGGKRRGRGGRNGGGRGDRGGRGGRYGDRDRHDRGGNYDRVERHEAHADRVARDEAQLTGEPKPVKTRAERDAEREAKVAARKARLAEKNERFEREDREREEQRRAERGDRGERGGRGGRYGDRDRGGRGGRGGDRPYRDRNDRGGRGYDRDRGERPYGDRDRRDDRGYGERNDRRGGERGYGRDRDDNRGGRGYGERGNDRGGRSYGDRDRRDDRGGERSYGDRGNRSYGERGNDRGGYRDRFERDDRGSRTSRSYDRDDRHDNDRGGYRSSSRGNDRGYGSKGSASSPKQYGMQKGRKPGDRGGDR
jgi:ATP-dependent RNA helicase RhlE